MFVVARDCFAWVDFDAFAALVAVTAPAVFACLVGAWVFGVADLVDTFLGFGAFRAWVIIVGLVDACLRVFVADLVIGAYIASAEVLACVFDKFLGVFSDRVSAEVFADLVDAFLAVSAGIAWVCFFVLALSIFASLIFATFGAGVFLGGVNACVVDAFLFASAYFVTAFLRVAGGCRAIVSAACKCERSRCAASEHEMFSWNFPHDFLLKCERPEIQVFSDYERFGSKINT